MSLPGLSCLVNHLNQSISEPDLVWEYSLSKSVHASFKDVVPAILITNSDFTDLLDMTLMSLSLLSQMLLSSWSPGKGLVSMPDTTPHILQYSNLPRIIPLFIFKPICVAGTEMMSIAYRQVPGCELQNYM